MLQTEIVCYFGKDNVEKCKFRETIAPSSVKTWEVGCSGPNTDAAFFTVISNLSKCMSKFMKYSMPENSQSI